MKPSTHAGFVYRDSLWRGADLIATGVASFGHFQGVHYQNLDSWETYIAALDRDELPVNRALPVTDHQRLIREARLGLYLFHHGKRASGLFPRTVHTQSEREGRGKADEPVSAYVVHGSILLKKIDPET